MEPHIQIDATNYSFEDFVELHFNHEFAQSVNQEWYWNSDLIFAPTQFCAYHIRLFHEPEILFSRFSKAQLEGGFWGMISGVDWSLRTLLWELDIPFSQRKESVRAMVDPFRRFFAVEPLDTSCHMWWDALCYDWHSENRVRERGGEDLQMQDVMFETLSSILYLDAAQCQAAALHGLGHLHHPETHLLINKYIDDHPSLTHEQREYALAATKFQVL
jgi:hypothetical protein